MGGLFTHMVGVRTVTSWSGYFHIWDKSRMHVHATCAVGPDWLRKPSSNAPQWKK